MKHNHSNFEDCSESFHTKTNDISIFISKHEQKINMSEAEWVYFLDIISLVHVDVKISNIIFVNIDCTKEIMSKKYTHSA